MISSSSDDPLIAIEAVKAVHLDVLGRKAFRLAELHRISADSEWRVPPAVFLTSRVYQRTIEASGVEPVLMHLQADPPSSERAEREAAQLIEKKVVSLELHSSIEAELEHRLATLGGRVAVRSSGTLEDLPGATFAGQHASFMNLRSIDEVVNAIRKCWASSYSAEVIAYRRMRGITGRPQMCVIIQQMIASRKAGVVFSSDPMAAARGSAALLIEATWGLGQALVNGSVTPDAYWLRHSDMSLIRRDIGTKSIAMYCSRGSGIRIVTTGLRRSMGAVMTAAELRRVAALALRAEAFFSQPQDIEWALDGRGNLFALQSRDIVSAGTRL